MKRNVLATLGCLIFVVGCSSTVSVQPIDVSVGKITEICIERNSKVIVPQFTDALQEGFSRHGIITKIYADVPSSCSYRLTYTAREGWAYVRVLTGVHLAVYKKDQLIGAADRNSPPNGGVNFSKWDSTRTIINPMIDELLGGIAPLQATE